jgi:hypothetical protein
VGDFFFSAGESLAVVGLFVPGAVVMFGAGALVGAAWAFMAVLEDVFSHGQTPYSDSLVYHLLQGLRTPAALSTAERGAWDGEIVLGREPALSPP